jgi:hypothetical protein
MTTSSLAIQKVGKPVMESRDWTILSPIGPQ